MVYVPGFQKFGSAVSAVAARVLYVDAGSSVATAAQNGSLLAPFKTIQQALNAVPAATTAADMRKGPWQIHIASGTYDEALSFSVTAKQVMLVVHGIVLIGTFDAAGWLVSGTRRNMTLTGDFAPDAALGSVQPFFAVCADTTMLTAIFELRIGNIMRLSGYLDMSGLSIPTSTLGLYLTALTINGSDGLATGNGIIAPPASVGFLSVYMSDVSVIGVTTGQLAIRNAVRCTFSGAVSVNNFVEAFRTNFTSNITCTQNLLAYPGLIACSFGNNTVWTSPAGGTNWVCDSLSLYRARSRNLTFSGGIRPSPLVEATTTRLQFGGVPLLANDRLVYGGAANATAVAALNVVSQALVSHAAYIDSVVVVTATGDGTTLFRVLKNGSAAATFSGTIAVKALSAQLALTFNDLIAIEYVSGTLPGPTTVVLEVSPAN